MKKLIIIMLAILLVLPAFSACSSQKTQDMQSTENTSKAANQNKQPVEITWAVFETVNLSAELWQKIMSSFEKDNPDIKIKKVLLTGDSRPTALRTMYAAGNFPDINIEAEAMAKVKGIYAPVPEELISKYEDAKIVECFGEVTMIPAFTQYRHQVFYHKNKFKEYGLEIPKTWDEFIDICEKIKSHGDVPMMLTGGAKDIWATGASYFLCQVNQELYNAYPEFNKDVLAGKVKWNNPVLFDTLKRWQDLINAGYYHKGSMSFGVVQAWDEFMKGSTVMMPNGSWEATTLDVEKNTEISSFIWPTYSGVKNYSLFTGYWAVAATCKNKEEAFRFVEYALGGNPEVYKLYLAADSFFSTTKIPVEYETGPVLSNFVSQYTSEYKIVPEIDRVAGDLQLPAGFADYKDKMMQRIFTGADVGTELEELDKEFVRLMDAAKEQN